MIQCLGVTIWMRPQEGACQLPSSWQMLALLMWHGDVLGASPSSLSQQLLPGAAACPPHPDQEFSAVADRLVDSPASRQLRISLTFYFSMFSGLCAASCALRFVLLYFVLTAEFSQAPPPHCHGESFQPNFFNCACLLVHVAVVGPLRYKFKKEAGRLLSKSTRSQQPAPGLSTVHRQASEELSPTNHAVSRLVCAAGWLRMERPGCPVA